LPPRRIFRTPLVEGESYDHLTFWNADIAIRPSSLRNSEAGRWMTTFRVLDRDPESVMTFDARVVRASRAKVNASPEPVAAGGRITVTGKLERANWNTRAYGGYAGQAVTVEFRGLTGPYQTLTSTKTSSSGAVRTTVRATSDGFYRLVFPGNSTSGATHTPGDYVEVR
jgi:hypothetical protein